MSTTDPKPVDVEVGIDNIDTKSDTGSATTAPSVESGEADSAAAPTKKSRRNNKLIGGSIAALLIVVGIIVSVVLTSNCDKNKKNKSTTAITTEESIVSTGGDDEAPPMYSPEDAHKPPSSVMFSPPFGDVTLPTFQENILESYQSVEALQQDLTLAVKAMINKVILQNLAYYSYTQSEEEMGVEELAMSAGVGASAASAAGKQASQQKVLNSLTNNQERDVDEADVLKNDDTYVYAAYGDYLVVWDHQGNMVTQEKMPVPEAPEVEGTPEDYYFSDHSMTYAYIESIQLTQNHILVIVGGLGEYTSQDIAYGNTGTHLRIYNKPTASASGAASLELVGTRDIQGYYFHSRYLEATDSIHIVTGGDFSTFSSLVEPLDVYHFDGLDETQYYNKAKTMAENKLIPAFVQKMTDFFVEGNNGQLPSILKVNNWLTQAQHDAKIAKEQDLMDSGTTSVHAEEHFYGSYDDAFRSYMLVTSLAAKDLPTTASEELKLSTTAIMGPSSYGSMYAKGQSIILTVDRYEWDAETNHSEETLFLIHLMDDSNGHTTPTPYGIAHMPGYVPNIRSIDIQGDDLRIATTYQKWMPLENVWPVCGDAWYFEDTCMTESNWNECFDVALNCRSVVKKGGCPYTEFECADDPNDPENQSSTENYVTVLDISVPGQMTERGSVAIGEPHEVIMGVHFGETFSYANTFDQRDPFYVLNLPAGQAPTIAGEIKLEGFSSYLQPLNDDATIILGIGQNVTGEGMDQGPNGLLVTVFDVSNTAEPKVLASDMLVNPNEQESYSDAEWDAKAVQYNDGILVIPVTFMRKYRDDEHDDMIWDGEETLNAVIPPEPVDSTTNNNFEGYLVLDVSDVASQGIKEVARIDQSVQKQQGTMEDCHYCSGYISYRRSFLFEDNSLMTVHDTAVMSTDLTTGDRLWSFNVTMDGEERNCCY